MNKTKSTFVADLRYVKKQLMTAIVVVVVGFVALFPSCTEGAVYKVGGSAGWTTVGNVDYKQWAATKTFQVGDLIIFQYDPQFHNVMQVTHAAFRSCNASSPMATHTTGNDSITVSNHGHHFFFCGVPGHCQSGQKVDINVIRHQSTSSVIAPVPPVASSPSSSTGLGAAGGGDDDSNPLSPAPVSAAGGTNYDRVGSTVRAMTITVAPLLLASCLFVLDF